MALSHRPTRKQLALLRNLARRRAETFADPSDRRAASAEIRRLLPRAEKGGAR